MKRIIITAFALLSLAVATGASAKQQVIANPATACKALVAVPGTGYTALGTCASTVWAGVAAYQSFDESGALINLDQRCAQFEAGITDPASGMTFRFTYPGFLLDEGPDWPFVTFTINNHQQCMLALYTYHALATAAFGGEG